MNERFVKKLVLPSFVVVVLSTVFFNELQYVIDKIFFKEKHFLVIGILSAPGNFQQRLSIRKTWLQLLSDLSGSYYFIIGNEICEVPVLDRPDPYSCVSQPFILSQNVTTDTEFSTMEIPVNSSGKITSIPNYVGFGFYVRSQIVIRKLGILKALVKLIKNEIQVKLISAYNRQILASVTFGPISLSESKSEILMKAIKPVTLVEYSEAFIKIESNDMKKILLPDCKFTNWVEGSNVITYINLWQSDSVMPTPFTKKSCTYVLMTYNLVDVDNIKKSIQSRNTRLKEWQEQNKKLSQQLSDENKIYNDIMFLDVVDVYRNINMKLVEFYKRILDTEYFDYILKADDDSFIDLSRVHNQLEMLDKQTNNENNKNPTGYNKRYEIKPKSEPIKFWCWSFFREFWKVQHYGKWRESQYKSASYPSFPCGGGYVINKGIVNYIVTNEQNINYFQGEDVSMGIWISALPVIYYKTPNISRNYTRRLQKKIIIKFKGRRYWSDFKTKNKSEDFAPDVCEWTCNNEKNHKLPSCNKVQMSLKSMYNAWDEYVNNGYL